MATIVIVETDKQLPPKGSSRRNRLVTEIQTTVGAALNDSMITVNLEKRK